MDNLGTYYQIVGIEWPRERDLIVELTEVPYFELLIEFACKTKTTTRNRDRDHYCIRRWNQILKEKGINVRVRY